uniref:Uncharacterized protein n=1 Tax=Arundo donax TaxID=35708 RepID=A0A0A9E616_ARUDO
MPKTIPKATPLNAVWYSKLGVGNSGFGYAKHINRERPAQKDETFCPETTKASTWSWTTNQNARMTMPEQIPAITSVKLCIPKYILAMPTSITSKKARDKPAAIIILPCGPYVRT